MRAYPALEWEIVPDIMVNFKTNLQDSIFRRILFPLFPPKPHSWASWFLSLGYKILSSTSMKFLQLSIRAVCSDSGLGLVVFTAGLENHFLIFSTHFSSQVQASRSQPVHLPSWVKLKAGGVFSREAGLASSMSSYNKWPQTQKLWTTDIYSLKVSARPYSLSRLLGRILHLPFSVVAVAFLGCGLITPMFFPPSS